VRSACRTVTGLRTATGGGRDTSTLHTMRAPQCRPDPHRRQDPSWVRGLLSEPPGPVDLGVLMGHQGWVGMIFSGFVGEGPAVASLEMRLERDRRAVGDAWRDCARRPSQGRVRVHRRGLEPLACGAHPRPGPPVPARAREGSGRLPPARCRRPSLDRRDPPGARMGADPPELGQRPRQLVSR
jgi:hypothetical protein